MDANIDLIQDLHTADSVEFESYPPHAHTIEEAATVPEILRVSFRASDATWRKNSLLYPISENFRLSVTQGGLNRFLHVGNCTDLCIYMNAMQLQMMKHQHNLKYMQVIVAANLVNTFEITNDQAFDTGAMEHPGDLFHRIFLYHMHMNGVQIINLIKG